MQARSRVSVKGRKIGISSASDVCAAPDCYRTISKTFFRSEKSVVTQNKMAHALSRKVALVQGTHICASCYKLFCRHHISSDVSASRSRAWREEQQAAAAARSPQPPRQTRRALSVSKQSSLDLPVETSTASIAVPAVVPVIAFEPQIGVVGGGTVTAFSTGTAAVVATGAARMEGVSAPNRTSVTHTCSPAAECCGDHALARQVLLANAYGWFSDPVNFSAGPRRAVCTNPFSREAYPDIDWGLWTQPGEDVYGSDYYITDTTSRVTLIGDRSLLFKFLDGDHLSRQPLLSCKKLQLVYSRAALSPTTRREELIRSTKRK